MSEKTLGAKHNLSLSTRVWGELKLRALQENTTTSELIAFILKRFLTDPPSKINASRYQLRGSGEGKRSGRTLYLPDAIWFPAVAAANQGGYSITNLVDLLAKEYLGLATLERDPQGESEPEPGSAARYVKVGGTTFDLGENPFNLDLKTGEMTRPNKPE